MSGLCYRCRDLTSTMCKDCLKPYCTQCHVNDVCFKVSAENPRQNAVILVALQQFSMYGNKFYKASSMFGPKYVDRFGMTELYTNQEVHKMHIYHEVSVREKQRFVYELPDNESGKIDTDYELQAFYNFLVDSDEQYHLLMNEAERTLFRGLGRAILCVLIDEFNLDNDGVIVLEAYGNDPRKADMHGLVNLYQSLSFELIEGELYDFLNNDLPVPMKTTIGRLKAACNLSNIRNLITEGEIGILT